MKTHFLRKATKEIDRISNAMSYVSGENFAIGLSRLIDNSRNKNGQCPELAVEAYTLEAIKYLLCIDLFFTTDLSDETETICMPVLDLQKWLVFNGRVVWYMQCKSVMDWGATIKEEITQDIIQQYLRDICMARVAYKTVAFTIVDSLFTEFSAKIEE